MATPDSNIVVGLDIGTSKVVTIIADIQADGNVEISGYGNHPTTGMKKGVVVDIEEITNAIKKSVAMAEDMAGCKVHSVYTGIAGNHIRSLNSHGIVPIKSNQVTKSDIRQVIDAAKAYAIPKDQKIIHVIAQEFKIDSQAGIKDPYLMSGVRLEAWVHMIIGEVSAAQNIVNCIRMQRLDVADMVLEQVASSNAVLTQDEKDLGCMVIDIGCGTTDVAIFVDGAIRHTFVIPIGGAQVTNDIAVAFKTTTALAEQIKVSHGILDATQIDGDLAFDVPSATERELKSFSQQKLYNVVAPRFSELFNLIRAEVIKHKFQNRLGAGVVLTGGSAKMQGATRMCEKVIGVTTRIGLPRHVIGAQSVLKDSRNVTGVGLVLYAKEQLAKRRKEASQDKDNQNMMQRVKGWLKGNL